METNTNFVLHRGSLTNFFTTHNVVALVQMKMPLYCDGDFPLPILTHYAILPKGSVNLDKVVFNEVYEWFFEDTKEIDDISYESTLNINVNGGFDIFEESVSLWDMSCGLEAFCRSHHKKTFAVFLGDSGHLEFREIPVTDVEYEGYEDEDEDE